MAFAIIVVGWSVAFFGVVLFPPLILGQSSLAFFFANVVLIPMLGGVLHRHIAVYLALQMVTVAACVLLFTILLASFAGMGPPM